MSPGHWPDISLENARKIRSEAFDDLTRGVDPAAAKITPQIAPETSFRVMAEAMLDYHRQAWDPDYWAKAKSRLETYVFPILGPLPVARLDRAMVKAVLDSIHARGLGDTLKKTKTQISYVFRYAVDQGIQGVTDWTQQFHRAYPSPPSKNLACLTKQSDIAKLMKSIADYKSVNVITALAAQFSALTLARPGEVRRTEWAEIDFSDSLWRIPAAKMKARQPHLVPLAPQALALLEELRPITGHSRFLFPGFRGQDRPISEITVLSALRRMGYSKEEMCAHGFRGMASTTLNEKGWNRDWIERQLAHGERNKIRGAYNHTDFLPGRRQMMDWWAAHLDALQNDSPAPPLPF